ncbi:hypothetical protein EDC96DRAFT_217133 [Choanephora cucurbitarum]|nr:hypothetical protein EDC96DRAFT_217133 [Choanephora cucurbitarum]
MDYDQYATQLLNSVFENAKQSSSNSNWHLLEQLEEQKKLILEQQHLLEDLKSTIRKEDIVLKDTGLEIIPTSSHGVSEQKVQSVPSQQLPLQNVSKQKLPLQSVSKQQGVSEQKLPVKQKSFLRRSLSRRHFQDRENRPPEPTKPQQSQLKTDKKVLRRETSDYEQETMIVDQTPTFWKPRQERPKDWWKGNRGTSDQKRVIQPKKVPSLQGTKVKRPMAFKTPSIKKKKQVSRKKINTTSLQKDNDDNAQETPHPMPMPMPMYMMPQQPLYYQQPMMTQPYMTPIPSYPTHQQDMPTQATKRKTSVLNPREHSNDKCILM